MTRDQFAAHVAQLDPIGRMLLADGLDIAIGGGCPACDLEADQMCAGCGLCNCDSHETCVRPS